MWDLSTGQPVTFPLTGHTSMVRAVACTVLAGRSVAITGGDDRTVRVWDLSTGQPVSFPLTGHNRGVSAVACTVLAGRRVAVTGSDDATVRVWDLDDHRRIDVWPFWDGLSAAATADRGWLVAAAGWDIAVFAVDSRSEQRS
nr:hypothetical protein [Dactylosporangium siamense]